jgi:hypothetical protein
LHLIARIYFSAVLGLSGWLHGCCISRADFGNIFATARKGTLKALQQKAAP